MHKKKMKIQKIVNDFPPIYDEILNHGMKPTEATIYTYGDSIFNPHKNDILYDILAHEEVHANQQGDNPKEWWDKYLENKDFRIKEEAEAYGAQYAFICNSVKDRNSRARILHSIATILSGPIYGNAVGYQEATNMVRSASKIK